MQKKYNVEPNVIKKSEILKRKSFSGKDYWRFVNVKDGLALREMVDYKIGDSFLRDDFTFEDDCNKYRFIKTGNLSPHKMLVDFTNTQYCKPNGKIALEDGDILIAKDGGANGLGDTSIYFKTEDKIIYDYFSGEVLRVRVKPEYDKWYILAILKSQYFKEYLDGVTPGGSTLRHSKLLALDLNIPYSEDIKLDIQYISNLMENLVDKELQMKKKIKLIDSKFDEEINVKGKNDTPNRYAKISEMKYFNRMDTGIFNYEYKVLEDCIKKYKNGFYYINVENISPGRTPDDYKYSNKKMNNTFLWITPKNINTLELIYRTYIGTKSVSKVSKTDIILSGIRYLGYGYYVDGEEIIFSNQNTLIISNDNKDKDEQIFLLTFLTSSIGKKMQMAWRVDGMVPILYREGLSNIPIPNFNEELRKEIITLYYNEKEYKLEDVNREQYINIAKKRNEEIGIFQLNNEIIKLKDIIEGLVEKVILGEEIEKKYNMI